MINVPNSMIVQNPYQRRVEYGDISELAQQIAAAYDQYPESRGIMQIPRGRLVDRTTGDVVNLKIKGDSLTKSHQSKYRIELLYGHRRLEALRWLQEHDERYKDGLVFISLTPATDEQMLDAVWAENAQRRNLSAVEEARLMADALDALSNGAKYTQKSLAERWGIAQPTVANRLRLLQLPEAVQAANQSGLISERAAVALLDVQKLIDADYQVGEWETIKPADVIARAISGDMTSDEIRKKAAGWILYADAIPASMEADEVQGVGVVQKKCKGCTFNLRANNGRRCVNSTCHATKSRILATSQATAVAADLVLEYQHDAYIEEEIKYWSKNHRNAATLCDALNNHLDLIGEHIIVTANLDQNYTNLPIYRGEAGGWELGGGRRYATLATSRLKYDELLALIPTTEENDDAPVEIDYEAQPLGRRYEWYAGQMSAATDTAVIAVERFIEQAVEGMSEGALNLFCRVLDVSLSNTPEVNEARLAESIARKWGNDPVFTVNKLGVEANQINRHTAEAVITATLADYIDETKRYGVMPYEARRYAPQLILCLRYARAHKIDGQLYDDLRTALEQCELDPDTRL